MADFQRICSVEGCGNRAVNSRGWCNRHYKRFWRYGSVDVTKCAPNGTHRAWLEAHVSHAGSECLIWPFSRGVSGRGSVVFDGRGMPPARAMCKIAHGEPPTAEHEAAHLCHNGHGGCVNPQHLAWQTQAENNADKPRMRKGARHAMAKVGPVEVIAIRLMARTHSQRHVAEQFGIVSANVGCIVRRETWKHL